MAAEGAGQVLSCEELSVGDGIEAWHNGKLFHRGEVIRTVAATDLFWILDERTGTRRLIDAEALLILRVDAPGAGHGPKAGGGAPVPPAPVPPATVPPATTAPAAAAPASHVPLFQAPSLVP